MAKKRYDQSKATGRMFKTFAEYGLYMTKTPLPVLNPSPTCMVYLYVKQLEYDKEKRTRDLRRDRNTVLITKMGAPKWKHATVPSECVLYHGKTPDRFLFASMPAVEACHLM